MPEAVRIVPQEEAGTEKGASAAKLMEQFLQQPKHASGQKSLLRKNRAAGVALEGSLTSAEAQQVRSQPLAELGSDLSLSAAAIELLAKDDGQLLDKSAGATSAGSLVDFIKARKKFSTGAVCTPDDALPTDDHILDKQQILEEIHVSTDECNIPTIKIYIVTMCASTFEMNATSFQEWKLLDSK